MKKIYRSLSGFTHAELKTSKLAPFIFMSAVRKTLHRIGYFISADDSFAAAGIIFSSALLCALTAKIIYSSTVRPSLNSIPTGNTRFFSLFTAGEFISTLPIRRFNSFAEETSGKSDLMKHHKGKTG